MAPAKQESMHFEGMEDLLAEFGRIDEQNKLDSLTAQGY